MIITTIVDGVEQFKPEIPRITIEVASIVAGFLQVSDIENLMRTCKQIHTDNLVRKVCIDKLTEQYTRRLYPVHAGDYRIHTRNGFQRPRVYRIFSQLGYRSAYLLLGELDDINSVFFHIHYEGVFYSFPMPLEPFTDEDWHASEVPVRSLVERDFFGTVIGISFRQLENPANSMSIALVNRRKKLLDYLSKTNATNYKKILEKLNIRK